jgi:hypothetical protein
MFRKVILAILLIIRLLTHIPEKSFTNISNYNRNPDDATGLVWEIFIISQVASVWSAMFLESFEIAEWSHQHERCMDGNNSHVESLQSHFILTMSHLSSGLPVCFPSQGTWVQIPWGVLMWNRDSPVSINSLHWWPQHDWSLWPRLKRALSWTVTRPSGRKCDNPTWSHTAFLSWFHARCRSPFRLHNRCSRLLGGEPCGEPAISLLSHHVSLGQWTTRLLPITRDLGSNPLGGTYMEPGFSC